MPFINRITGITGVAQGGTALVNLDVGPRYFTLKFWVRVNNVLTLASSVIDSVRIKVNEKTVRELSAARILAINAFNGTADAAGCLSIHFAEPGRADKQDEVFTAWDTNGENSFTVELVLKNLAEETDVIRINGLKFFDFGMWRGPNGERQKNIVTQKVLTEGLTAGQYDITKIPTRNPLLRVHFAAANPITYLEVDADGSRVWEASDVEAQSILGNYGLVGTTFAYTYAADYREQVTDFLAVQKTVNFRATSAAAQPVDCIIEALSPGFANA
jgi:hypothetical protein